MWNREKTEQALSNLGKAGDFLSKRVENLSGGEKQIVTLLRALSLSPELLCLDEPTSALDQTTALRLERFLLENFTGAWVWVTHLPDQATRISSRQIRLSGESEG